MSELGDNWELPALSYYRRPGEYAPIPARAFDGTRDDLFESVARRGFYSREIRDGIYYITEGRYFMLVVVHSNGVLVVDAPPSIHAAVRDGGLRSAVETISSKPITHVIYTHHHRDHIGAASELVGTQTEVVAHRLCAEALVGRPDRRGPVPGVTFDTVHELDLGFNRLELSYRGDIHCAGNIFIYAPAQRVLMLVDVVFPGWVPFAHLAVASNLHGFLHAHDVALSFQFDTLVPGHVTRLGSREDVELQRAYIHDLVGTTSRVLAKGSAVPGVGENMRDTARLMGADENVWLAVDVYLNSVAESVTTELLPRWVGVLGAADVFTRSHAWSVASRLRKDA